MCNWPLNNRCLNCTGPLSLKLFLFYWLICFVAVLGLPCCVWAFSSWSQQGLLSGCNAQASHRGGFFCCGECGLSSLGIGALLPHTMWNLPGAGIQPLSPAMPGRSLTTRPPGKTPAFMWIFFKKIYWKKESWRPETIWKNSQMKLIVWKY